MLHSLRWHGREDHRAAGFHPTARQHHPDDRLPAQRSEQPVEDGLGRARRLAERGFDYLTRDRRGRFAAGSVFDEQHSDGNLRCKCRRERGKPGVGVLRIFRRAAFARGFFFGARRFAAAFGACGAVLTLRCSASPTKGVACQRGSPGSSIDRPSRGLLRRAALTCLAIPQPNSRMSLRAF